MGRLLVLRSVRGEHVGSYGRRAVLGVSQTSRQSARPHCPLATTRVPSLHLSGSGRGAHRLAMTPTCVPSSPSRVPGGPGKGSIQVPSTVAQRRFQRSPNWKAENHTPIHCLKDCRLPAPVHACGPLAFLVGDVLIRFPALLGESAGLAPACGVFGLQWVKPNRSSGRLYPRLADPDPGPQEHVHAVSS